MVTSRALADVLQATLPSRPWRTRFAPAPTGFLHLGHLVNAIYVWGIARAYGGSVLLRIEDHDRTRCRPEYEQALLADLSWLGLRDDEIPTVATQPLVRQSERTARYETALAHLEAHGHVYACRCSRRDIVRGLPVGLRVTEDEVAYAGTCRDRAVDAAFTLARRVVLAPTEEHFTDMLLGAHAQQPWRQCGDVLARNRHGDWTYQFAVTVDDADQEIDVIIRGEDLLASVGRQQQLSRLLGRNHPPLLLHHPLLSHPNGEKLSKAHGDTAIAERRALGATPSQLLGEAAFRAGVIPRLRALEPAELPSLFR